VYQYKNLMVALNWSDEDVNIIHYASKLSRLTQAQKCIFFHVHTKDDAHSKFEQSHQELKNLVPSPGSLSQYVQEEWSGDEKTSLHFKVEESGPPLLQILKNVKQEATDLLILGRKDIYEHIGMISEKLVRKAPCSVLVVPSTSPPSFSKILIPVDHSLCSLNALEIGAKLASGLGLKDLNYIHIFDLPVGFHGSKAHERDFSSTLLELARSEFQKFSLGIDTLGCELLENYKQGSKPGPLILEATESLGADFIIMGSRGRDAIAWALLGSTAEHIVRNSKVPVLVVKRKDAGMKVLDAILEHAILNY
jgi:nucleotide-binding universal stress UspA family protein